MKHKDRKKLSSREQRIADEIQKRVFEESRRCAETKRAADDRKIEIEALSEVSELPPARVAEIVKEVRAEYAAGEGEKKHFPFGRLVIWILIALVISGVIVFRWWGVQAKQAEVQAQLKRLTFYSELETAVKEGNLAMTKYLLDQGAPMHIMRENLVANQPEYYAAALYTAAYWERTQIVKLLLERGADIKLQNAGHSTALDAAIDHEYKALVQILGQAMAEAYPENSPVRQLWARQIPFSRFAFIDCVVKDDQDAVRLFMAAGMDINAEGKWKSYDDVTALTAAAREENLAMVQLLLSLVRPDNKPLLDEPLEAAARQDNPAVVKLLLQAGADPDTFPFYYALHNLEIAALLLDFGVDINKGWGDDLIPALIYLLAPGGHPEIKKKQIKFLLAHGADVTNRGEGLASARKLAESWGDPEVIRWIAEAEAAAEAGSDSLR